GGNDCDLRARHFLHPLEVGLGVLRQLVEAAHAEGGLAPAGQALVHRLDAGQAFGADGRGIHGHAVDLVAGADAHRLHAVEDVELGDAQAGDAVVEDGAARGDGVEPAAAARAAGDGAVFVALVADGLADVVVQLGRERAGADAGGVGLDDAQHVVELARADAGAGGGAAGGGVAAGDVGIGAVVDVEHGALGALEQHIVAGDDVAAQQLGDVRHQGADLVGEAEAGVEGLLEVDRRVLEVMGEDEVVVVQHLAQLGGQALAVEQVADADGAAGDLVLVGGADATAGGADLVFAAGALARLVELDVVLQDQRAGLGDLEATAHRDAARLQALDFLDQAGHVDHHAVADEAVHALAHDA